MSLAIAPLVPGDLFETAMRLATATAARLAAAGDAQARAPLLNAAWDEVTTLGWPAVLIPESCGGADGTLQDLAAIVAGAGRSALPLPLASVCGVVPAMLPPAAREAILPRIAAGEWHVAPAFAALHRDPRQAAPDASLHDDELRLKGAVIGVEAPPQATHVLLQCAVSGAPGLILLPTEGVGIRCSRFERLDGRPSLDLAIDGASLPRQALVGVGAGIAVAVDLALVRGALLTCVDAVSAMGALIEQTVAYLSARVQFGETLSRFQALRHNAVDLYAQQEAARALVTRLLADADDQTLEARSVSLAKLHINRVSRTITQGAVQLHGGMGLTEELAASRLIKRLMMVEFDFGDQAYHAARVSPV